MTKLLPTMRPMAHGFGEPVILDLRHIDRRVPGGKQGRGADVIDHLVGGELQVVAELGVRHIIIGEGLRLIAKLRPQGLQQQAAGRLERVLVGPRPTPHFNSRRLKFVI